ncbi:MAG: hypothetical protein KDB14_10775 [Planctomycetales bacterium]|nr:hypothetical protein [Planctomycetales bacterium]
MNHESATGRDDARVVRRRIFAMAAMFLFCWCVAGSLGAEELTLEQVARLRDLAKQLGHPQFAEREAAQRELREFGEAARETLQRAAEDPDRERSMRAKVLLGQLLPMTHVIVDANEQLIPHAKVVLLSGDPSDPQRGSPRFCTSQGEFGLKDEEAELSPLLEVSHPDYGVARIQQTLPEWVHGPEGRQERKLFPGRKVYRVPLLSKSSPQHDRCVRGRLLDAEAKPVPGAIVQCRNVRTSGAGLISGSDPLGQAVSDASGEFCFYLPDRYLPGGKQRGLVIPPQSFYELEIDPVRRDCFPLQGSYRNGQLNEIQLPAARERHTFRFELREGQPLTAAQLTNISVTFLGNGDTRAALSSSDLLNGRRLAYGKYVAQYYDNGKRIEFVPLQVNAESDEVLTFKRQAPLTFFGQVVDGATGEPAPRAFVFTWSSTSYNNLAALSEEDWRLLEQVESQAKPEGEVMTMLRRHYGVLSLVRADEQGRFEIVDPDRNAYGVMAVSRDTLPIARRVYSIEVKADRGDVGQLPLFPAAYAEVELKHDTKRGNLSASAEWRFEEGEQPAWLDEMRTLMDKPSHEICYVHWLKLNERAPVYVPAGAHLKLRFRSPYHDEWTPAVSEAVQLPQGQSRTLKPLEFEPSVTVIAKVVGPDGQPIEGVPLRRKHAMDGGWSVAHNTDANGEAKFYIHRKQPGHVAVKDLHQPQLSSRNGDAPARKPLDDPNLQAAFPASEQDLTEPLEIKLNAKQLAMFRE